MEKADNGRLIDFNKLFEGQAVYHILKGKTYITNISNSSVDYPISIKNKMLDETFTKEGKRLSDDEFPSIYATNPFQYLIDRVSKLEKENKELWERISITMEVQDHQDV